jgi:hypothetical protein
MMTIPLDRIDLDSSIQCRATIDVEVVNDYAERMVAGDTFPPIEVFGNRSQCWIGDGWHRVLARKQGTYSDIEVNLHRGGRAEALKHALSANLTHGHRRSNADKRRCVEIAVREFTTLSNVAIATLCGVDDKTVAVYRPVNLGNSEAETRMGQDGKQHPARQAPRPRRTPAEALADREQTRQICVPMGITLPPEPEKPKVVPGESEVVATLKAAWKQASPKERNQFVGWVQVRGQRRGELRLHKVDVQRFERPETTKTDGDVHEPESDLLRLPSGALRELLPPSNGMQFARLAIMRLEEIGDDDLERQQAFEYLSDWLERRGA